MLGLSVAVALGLAAAGKGPAALTTPAEVEALCRALARGGGDVSSDPVARADEAAARPERRRRALDRSYELRVPGRQLHFRSYDAENESLRIDDRFALGAIGGALAIYPAGDGDGSGFALRATPEQARRVVRAAASGDGALLVRFRPSGSCAGDPMAHAFSLGAQPGELAFVAEGGKLALPGAGDWEPRPPGGAPTLKVLPAVVASGGVDQAGLASRLETDAALRRCYAEALDRDPEASGAVILSVAGKSGAHDVQVAMDTTEDPRLAACLSREVAATSLPTTGDALLYVPLELGR